MNASTPQSQRVLCTANLAVDESQSKVQPVFAESQAAAIRHAVIRVEKTMGVMKAYLQFNAVIATKQMASAHAMLRTRAKVSAGSPPSSHANTAANKRKTEKKSPNALKKSQ
ncbi:MAG: hypothetical protein WB869_18320 [Candidatus Acidiferrales bacterium]